MRRFSTRARKTVFKVSNASIELASGNRVFPNTTLDIDTDTHLCIVGRNGQGKSLLMQALTGKLPMLPPAEHGRALRTTYMSFAMHNDFLQKYGDKVVADVLNVYDATCRQLIVQMGLYPVYNKKVRVLSTGEIRKVLLAYALSSSPHLCVLNKPFDGLDKPSRDRLSAVLSKICLGFPPLLVDIGTSKKLSHSQLVLCTHRVEEVPDDISHVVFVEDTQVKSVEAFADCKERLGVFLKHTYSRTNIQIPDKLRFVHENSTIPVVNMNDASYSSGEAQQLLENVTWAVHQGERWAIRGLNGAGKSTIIRLITGHTLTPAVEVMGQAFTDEKAVQHALNHIGLVSTELHLHLARVHRYTPTHRVIAEGVVSPTHKPSQADMADTETVAAAVTLLGLGSLLDVPFGMLSQGQQKCACVCAALAKKPRLLIMDEVCQGLDAHNRALVMSVLDSLCTHNNITLLYISHHEDEQLRTLTHTLLLKEGRVEGIEEVFV